MHRTCQPQMNAKYNNDKSLRQNIVIAINEGDIYPSLQLN